MKLIRNYRETFPSKTKCHYCKETDYVVTTPFGADCVTCPICEHFIEMDNFTDDEDDIIENYLNRHNQNTKKNCFDFCPKCNVIFTSEKMHRMGGCTDSIYTAAFVKKFKFKNKLYNGMPQFNSKEELLTILKNDLIDIVEYEDTAKGGCKVK